MDVRYEQKDELVFIGYHTEIRPDQGYEECPKFWDEAFNRKYARLLATINYPRSRTAGFATVHRY